jgi:hypothetical protein
VGALVLVTGDTGKRWCRDDVKVAALLVASLPSRFAAMVSAGQRLDDFGQEEPMGVRRRGGRSNFRIRRQFLLSGSNSAASTNRPRSAVP